MKSIRVISLLILLLPLGVLAQGDQYSDAKAKAGRFVDLVRNDADSAIYLGVKLARQFEKDTIYLDLLPRVYLSLGNYYIHRDQLPEALANFQKVEDVATELGDSVYLAYAKGSKGYVYQESSRYQDALDVFRANLRLWQRTRYDEWVPVAMYNIGNTMSFMGRWDEAKSIADSGLAFVEEKQLGEGAGALHYLIGKYHLYYTKQLDKAVEHLLLGTHGSSKENDNLNELKARLELGNAYLAQRKWKLAAAICNGVFLRLKSEIIYRPQFLQSCQCLSNANKGDGNLEDALHYQHIYAQNNDSLAEMQQLARLNNMEIGHNLHKQLLKDSLDAVTLIEQQQLKHQSYKEQQQLIWILVGLLVVGLGVVIYYMSKSMKKQQSAYAELTVVNKELTDSITYAKRIQHAFLPSEAQLNKAFGNCHLIYQPKDIVAGDFYWLAEQNDQAMIAIADATGVSVNGAMMSVICQNALEHSTKEVGIENPAAVLELTHQDVMNRFTSHNQSFKEGMDIALCAYSRKSKSLNFAGAMIDIWVVSSDGVQLIKGSERRVGHSEGEGKFENHAIQLKEGDTVIVSTDGLAQLVPNASDVIHSLQGRTFEEMEIEINLTLMGEQDGTLPDDVCVFMFET